LDVRIFTIGGLKARHSLAACPWPVTLLRSCDDPPVHTPLGTKGLGA
jgi:hypothetical protein